MPKDKRRHMVVCATCGAERKCGDTAKEAALAGRLTCVKCAAAGRIGYFVDYKAVS